MTFQETITAAINDIIANGYDSQKRVDDWLAKIRKAARDSLVGERKLQATIKETLTTIYRRMVDQGKVWQYHPGAPARFTKQDLSKKLRRQLDLRIAASADLIVRNRQDAIEKTLQRFQGWSTSIPKGGSKVQDRLATKVSVKKALSQLPFEERRVLIDQGYKLVASISDVIAKDEGAIAVEWHSKWRQKNYNYREDHKERDYEWNKSQGRRWVYLIRGSWAQQKGLVKPGPAGYFDAITQPGEEVFCRCGAVYVYNVSSLPDEMLTEKGRNELERVRKVIAGG